jgi:hypothetical protein
MNNKPELLWYNFRTGQYETRDTPDGDEWADYISQNPAAQSLYILYVAKGETPIDAAMKVLKATAGIKEPQP